MPPYLQQKTKQLLLAANDIPEPLCVLAGFLLLVYNYWPSQIEHWAVVELRRSRSTLRWLSWCPSLEPEAPCGWYTARCLSVWHCAFTRRGQTTIHILRRSKEHPHFLIIIISILVRFWHRVVRRNNKVRNRRLLRWVSLFNFSD